MPPALRGLIWLCLTTSLFVQTSDEGFKSTRARKAFTEFEEAVKKLNQDYAKNFAGLQKRYSSELEECRKAALEAKNLDEAQRILTALNGLEEEMKEEKSGPGFLLISAKYGAADKWTDVTANLRRLLKRGPLTVAPDELRVSDPAFGLKKSLAVVYRLQGRTHLELYSDGTSVTVPPGKKSR